VETHAGDGFPVAEALGEFARDEHVLGRHGVFSR
jgi:hypothetical protein